MHITVLIYCVNTWTCCADNILTPGIEIHSVLWNWLVMLMCRFLSQALTMCWAALCCNWFNFISPFLRCIRSLRWSGVHHMIDFTIINYCRIPTLYKIFTETVKSERRKPATERQRHRAAIHLIGKYASICNQDMSWILKMQGKCTDLGSTWWELDHKTVELGW